MSKKWQYRKKKNIEEVKKIQEKFKLNKIISSILINREIKLNSVEIFLKPTRYDFHNPFEMPDMQKAVDRIIKAINNKEKIIIYGDYDVDGITSTAVLKSFLKDRGIDASFYIPNRLNEGYGLNKDAIKKISEENYKLIITVDTGITGIEEIEFAKTLGIDTIVTDHHEPGEFIPNAIAVIDCKRKDSKYPFRELCGAGVAFKLIQALSQELKIEEREYLKYLDIVSIGTISDIVPLIDENRVITKLGLKLVNETRNIGLRAILSKIGYNKIDSDTVAFGIAPRINACGRMGVADIALKLFLEQDEKKANELAEKLEKYNVIRQQEEKKIFDDAKRQIEIKKLENDEVIFLNGENWHIGVIGIVSSKITEMYYKPSILISYKNEIGKGSRKKYSRI